MDLWSGRHQLKYYLIQSQTAFARPDPPSLPANSVNVELSKPFCNSSLFTLENNNVDDRGRLMMWLSWLATNDGWNAAPYDRNNVTKQQANRWHFFCKNRIILSWLRCDTINEWYLIVVCSDFGFDLPVVLPPPRNRWRVMSSVFFSSWVRHCSHHSNLENWLSRYKI